MYSTAPTMANGQVEQEQLHGSHFRTTCIFQVITCSDAYSPSVFRFNWNEEIFHQRIFDARQIIRNRPGTFEMLQQSMIKRFHACYDLRRRYFEHLLCAMSR